MGILEFSDLALTQNGNFVEIAIADNNQVLAVMVSIRNDYTTTNFEINSKTWG